MKRLLIDYKKLDHAQASLLLETYPNGYGDDDIISFSNGKGELIQAVELRTEDVLYLVKISKSLNNFISNFEEAIEKGMEENTLEPQSELGYNLDEDGEEEQEQEVD